jgi:hypothetical protein
VELTGIEVILGAVRALDAGVIDLPALGQLVYGADLTPLTDLLNTDTDEG